MEPVSQFGYAKLTQRMEDELARVALGKYVFDIGCGSSTSLARYVQRKMRPARVVGVEKERAIKEPAIEAGLVEYRQQRIDVGPLPTDKIDVLLVSWPVNRETAGLVDLWMTQAETVVYIGCNDRATVCGRRSFFKALSTREVVANVTDPRNDMLIVGGPCRFPRPMTPTELAGMRNAVYEWEPAFTPMPF